MESPSLLLFHSSLHNKLTVIFFNCHTKLADQRQKDDYLKIKYEFFKHNSYLDPAFKNLIGSCRSKPPVYTTVHTKSVTFTF